MILNTKKILYAIVFTLLCSCSVKSEYEQEARERAVVAAQSLIATDHENTMKMEAEVLNAKAVQSEYLLLGDTLAAQAFDKAFRDYVTTNDSLLAQEIFN